MNSSDLVYTQLLTRILNGQLRPGDALKERDLCADLNVSRTPVREALRRLSAEGLAEIRPRRSIVVASFSDEEVAEIFEIGAMLESYLAGLAAQKANADDITTLASLVADMERHLEGPVDDFCNAYQQLDLAFHKRLAQIANSPRITEILRQTIGIRLLSQIFSNYAISDYKLSIEQHAAIVDAIRCGDRKRADEAMRRHIASGREVFIINH